MKKKLFLTFSLIGMMAIPITRALAAPDQTLVGSWCATALRPIAAGEPRVVPLILNFFGDGTMNAIAPPSLFFSNGDPGPASPLIRTTGTGEIDKVSNNEWEANYQYMQIQDGRLVNRFVAKVPITYDRETDTIRNPNDKTVTLITVFPNNTFGAPLPGTTFMATRIDKDWYDAKTNTVLPGKVPLCAMPVLP